MAAIDDSALRTAAQQLLAAARRSMPGVDWAAQVVESDHGFPSRRGTTKIDGELPTCAQKARPKPQIAAARRLTGWSGPSEAASYGGPTHDCCPGAGIWKISGQLIQIKRLGEDVP